jgi:hypothetical protein
MLLSYGEDALTLMVLSDHLSGFLRALGDSSEPSDALAIYRPSFGRKGTSKQSSSNLSACFGEFDAIIATPVSIYLVESKWSWSYTKSRPIANLSPIQVRRHKVMRAYLEEWKVTAPNSWDDFLERSSIRSRLLPLGVEVAKRPTVLSDNLRTLLMLLTDRSANVMDVLLYFRVESRSSPPSEAPPGFRLVQAECRTTTLSRFVPLTFGRTEPRMGFWLSPIIGT